MESGALTPLPSGERVGVRGKDLVISFPPHPARKRAVLSPRGEEEIQVAVASRFMSAAALENQPASVPTATTFQPAATSGFA